MLLYGIILILLGVLAASSVIVKNKPDAKELIDKLVPIQGWLGFCACIWGIWNLIWVIIGINISIAWFTALAVTVITACLGLLLGFSLISKFILSKNEEALAKGEALRMKLAGYQIPMGFAAIGLGIWAIIANFLYSSGGAAAAAAAKAVS